jgi:imidazoleglycerol phosphate dehydratase HisB
MEGRSATITRTTKETDISLELSLDGSGLRDNIIQVLASLIICMDSFVRHGFL